MALVRSGDSLKSFFKNMEKIEARKQREVEFHDRISREESQLLTSNRKFYFITQKSEDLKLKLALQWGRGKKILDYCCGEGPTSLKLAQEGLQVTGIDISPEQIKKAKEQAQKKGVEDLTSFLVMDGENMKFENNSFDLITCFGVLHHLDIKKAYSELARVLKPSGKIICTEPIIHNPVFQLYRKMTPHLRTKWEVGHISGRKEIKLAEKYFGRVEKRFFHLFTLLAVPFRNTFLFKPLLWLLEVIDFIILTLPGIKWFSWQIVFTLSNPKK